MAPGGIFLTKNPGDLFLYCYAKEYRRRHVQQQRNDNEISVFHNDFSVHLPQILFLVTNDSPSLHGQIQFRIGKLKTEARELKEKKQVRIVPVAIGDNAAVDDLKRIEERVKVISTKVYEIRSKLKHKLVQGK